MKRNGSIVEEFGDLNDNLGSNSIKRDLIVEKLKINDQLNINKDNIINISTAKHATLFYIFEKKR